MNGLGLSDSEAVGNLDLGSVKSMVKHLAVAAALGWLGVVAWRLSGGQTGSERAVRATTPLIRPGKPQD